MSELECADKGSLACFKPSEVVLFALLFTWGLTKLFYMFSSVNLLACLSAQARNISQLGWWRHHQLAKGVFFAPSNRKHRKLLASDRLLACGPAN